MTLSHWRGEGKLGQRRKVVFGAGFVTRLALVAGSGHAAVHHEGCAGDE
jgi:hypothetical protein